MLERGLDQEDVDARKAVDGARRMFVGASVGQADPEIGKGSTINEYGGRLRKDRPLKLGRSREGRCRCNGSVGIDVVDLNEVGAAGIVCLFGLIGTALHGVAGLGDRFAAAIMHQRRHAGSACREHDKGEEGDDGPEE